jgi:hypothetical protein
MRYNMNGIALVRLLKPLNFTKRNTDPHFTDTKNVSPYGKAAQSWTRWCWILQV